MRFTKAYITLISICSIAMLGACMSFLSVNYESLIRLAIETSNKPYIENTLRNSVFTISKYSVIRKVCVALLFVIPSITALLIIYRNKILPFIGFVYRSLRYGFVVIKNVFRQNSKEQSISILVVLIIVIARSLYYLIGYDLQYDEMWSYNYFTAQPFYYSFVVSSNYPLYEISTNLFKWLPFEMKINLRLPVFLAGVAACVVLYACLKKYLNNHLAALAGMTMFAFMPVSTFYMLYARGVMFNLFFSIIAIFSLCFWLRNKQQYRHLVMYVIANAAGFYSMPTHVYLWAILFLFSFVTCLLHFQSQVTYILTANAVGAAISFLLYAPILAGSGLSFLLTAAVDKNAIRPSFTEVLQYHFTLSEFFTGFGYGFVILFCFSILIFIITKTLRKHRFLLNLCGSLCLFPVITYLIQNVQIPARALAFTGLCIPLLFSIVISVITLRANQLLITFCIVGTGAGAAITSHHHSFLNWSIRQDKEAKQLANLFMQKHITTCYDNSEGSDFFYNYPALEYYYHLQNKTFVLFTNATNSLRYKPFSGADKYDCVVYHLSDSITDSSYHQIYINKEEGFKVLMQKK